MTNIDIANRIIMEKEKRKVLSRIHKGSGIMSLLIISSFFISSLYGEIIGNHDLIISIKTYIVFTIPIMILLMPVCAITGKKLAGKSKSSVVKSKNSRVKFIALNGIILIILACTLYCKATTGEIDNQFLYLQIAELALGLTNMVLLGFMIRDGRILSGKLKRR